MTPDARGVQAEAYADELKRQAPSSSPAKEQETKPAPPPRAKPRRKAR